MATLTDSEYTSLVEQVKAEVQSASTDVNSLEKATSVKDLVSLPAVNYKGNLVCLELEELSNLLEVTDGSITTAKIKDSAVTSDKIADGAVTKDKIAETALGELQQLASNTNNGLMSAEDKAKLDSIDTDSLTVSVEELTDSDIESICT